MIDSEKYEKFLYPAVLGILTIFLLIKYPVFVINRMITDDAFFYIKTAYNISQGVGSTFDGLNPTNGYHPLYMMVLVSISFFLPLRDAQGIYVVFILDMLLFISAVSVMDQFIRQNGYSRFARLVVFLGLLIALAFYDFGIESRLLLLLAWVFARSVYQLPADASYRRLIRAGLIGALVCLARLDAILWIGSIGLFFMPVFSPKNRQTFLSGIKRLIALISPAIIGLAIYSLYNLVVFSKPTSVSSWMKFGWPGTFVTNWFATSTLSIKLRFFFSLLAAVGILFYIIAKSRRAEKNNPSRFELFLCSLSMYTVLYLTILIFFARGEVRFWYFTLTVSFGIVALVYMAERIMDKARFAHHTGLLEISLKAIAVIALIILFTESLDKKLYWKNRNDPLNLALWMRERLSDSARIFQVDGSGVVGYLSEKTVINGDGLINSWAYQNYLRNNKLAQYLVDMRITHMVYEEYMGENRIEIPVPVKNCNGYLISFRKEPEICVRYGKWILIKVRLDEIHVKTRG